MNKYCIVTGEPITEKNDSRAHIIPSALGGRLKPKGVLSKKGNEILNDKIDLPLIESLSQFMVMIGASRDRGENRTIRMRSDDGRLYDFGFGLLKPAKPELKITEDDNGLINVNILARGKKDEIALLNKVKKQYPRFDIENAYKNMVRNKFIPKGSLHNSIEIGPKNLFASAFVAANLMSHLYGFGISNDFKCFLGTHCPTGDWVPPPDAFYFYPNDKWFKVDENTVSHIIIMHGDAEQGKLFFYIEYFNILSAAVILPFNQNQNFHYSHGIDLMSGCEIPVIVDKDIFNSLAWKATHFIGEDPLYEIICEKIRRVIIFGHERSREKGLGDVVEKSLGKPDGRILTQEDINKLAREVAEYIRPFIKRPKYDD